MTPWAAAPKKSTYARLLKPGDNFFGPGRRHNIHVVYSIEPVTDLLFPVFRITTTTGRPIHYGYTERVRLA